MVKHTSISNYIVVIGFYLGMLTSAPCQRWVFLYSHCQGCTSLHWSTHPAVLWLTDSVRSPSRSVIHRNYSPAIHASLAIYSCGYTWVTGVLTHCATHHSPIYSRSLGRSWAVPNVLTSWSHTAKCTDHTHPATDRVRYVLSYGYLHPASQE